LGKSLTLIIRPRPPPPQTPSYPYFSFDYRDLARNRSIRDELRL